MESKSVACSTSNSRHWEIRASLPAIAPITMPAAFAEEVGLSAACDADTHESIATPITLYAICSKNNVAVRRISTRLRRPGFIKRNIASRGVAKLLDVLGNART